MSLKKLELSGFKSFARNTVLEFPSKITGVVGPNGSGKSNIKEAIQWALGEQSMKSLRGKRGEDLIWNGSPGGIPGISSAPRMGKASVTLTFGNSDGKIPLEYEEVIINRRIFRDGANEYRLNNSQVRLRDIVELAARMGLGETKHNIIGQGEVDHVLLASPREKRSMLEEALGLRVYQLKKNETERKLEATENNIRQVESLLREIAPHLKFLRVQTEKHRARAGLEKELVSMRVSFIGEEKAEISEERKNIRERRRPLEEKAEENSKELKKILARIAELEKNISQENFNSEENRKLARLEQKRREFERELGRLEGKLEIEKERISRPRTRVVDSGYIQHEIKEFIALIKSMTEEENEIGKIKERLKDLAGNLGKLTEQIQKGTAETLPDEYIEESALIKDFQKTIIQAQKELDSINEELERVQGERQEEQKEVKESQQKIRELDSYFRRLQDEERGLALRLERFNFDEEKIKIRENVMRQSAREWEIKDKEVIEKYGDSTAEELKKKIDRLAVKLEEIGGIDAAVVKEFEETDSRHAHLAKESEDLKNARVSLEELLKELDEHIKNNFHEGLVKIKEEFNKLFKIIFGGGKASLILVKSKSKTTVDGEEDDEINQEPEEQEEGLEITVDLPRKRIKGLAMLSGGERALTSIALLFAITSINPPPFLILDETDAALDEANTQRYASILKELSYKTQLIIVTHNRETMKSAGVLYGVTMGNDGVSKLLSLKFEEAEEFTNR